MNVAALRAARRGRPAIRSRCGRHEGRPRRLPERVPRAAGAGPGAGRAGLPAVGHRGGVQRQRRACLPRAGLSRRCGGDPRAGQRDPGRPARRDVVDAGGHRRAGARDGHAYRYQCDRRGPQPVRRAAAARARVERAEASARDVVRARASDQLQPREAVGRRMGVLGRHHLRRRDPPVVLPGHEPRGRAGRGRGAPGRGARGDGRARPALRAARAWPGCASARRHRRSSARIRRCGASG